MEKQILHDMVDKLSEEKISTLYDFMSFIMDRNTPLDEYDYKLAKESSEDADKQYVSFDDVLGELGLDSKDIVGQ